MGQKVNSHQPCLPLLSLALSFLKGPLTEALFHLQPSPYCVAPFEVVLFRGLVVIGGEGRG